jgi:large subunit ribosomal protein L22
MAKSPVKQNTETKITTAEARLTGVRISPRKMRLVTNMVKGMTALDAIEQMRFTNKRAAKFVHDLLRSAVANASNNFKLNPESLYIKTITADMGAKLKRYMPRAQGRASEIRRPSSHLFVLLEERPKAKKARAALRVKASRKSAVVSETNATVTDPEGLEKKTTERDIASKTQIDKTSEQRKNNKVTQKRRLFNRKSGV